MALGTSVLAIALPVLAAPSASAAVHSAPLAATATPYPPPPPSSGVKATTAHRTPDSVTSHHVLADTGAPVEIDLAIGVALLAGGVALTRLGRRGRHA